MTPHTLYYQPLSEPAKLLYTGLFTIEARLHQAAFKRSEPSGK